MGEAPRTKNGPSFAGHGAEAVRDDNAAAPEAVDGADDVTSNAAQAAADAAAAAAEAAMNPSTEPEVGV